MKRKYFKNVKLLAVVVCSFSIITATVVSESIDTTAKTTYKVSKGKLINAKTKKVVKGYKIYNKKLFYNGQLKKEYKVYSQKLYYNGSLKKGYKVYSNKLYYNGSLKKGYKEYSKKLFKDGTLFTGTHDSIFYKHGIKFTGSINDVEYYNGILVEEEDFEIIGVE